MALTGTNTEELIARCRVNDQNAQLEIYNRFYKAMYNTALRIIKDTAEAEDVMQDAFLTAFTKLSSLDNDQLFAAWLKRIVVNASLTAFRKKEIQKEVSIDKVSYQLVDESDKQEDYTGLKASTVLETLNELKDTYSTALSLHLIEGYDYEEIGEIMNISYSNSRTLISRAKESLRKKIQMVKSHT